MRVSGGWLMLLAGVACCAAVGAAVQAQNTVPVVAPPPYPGEMNSAQSDYVEHCGGCHGIQGNAAPADLPTLQGRVGYFMCTPASRAYLLHLPNIARSRITDNQQLAELLNFMIFGLGGKSASPSTPPFTAEEVARERVTPLNSVSLTKVRSEVVESIIKSCGAPKSLRLLYPGQVPAKPH